MMFVPEMRIHYYTPIITMGTKKEGIFMSFQPGDKAMLEGYIKVARPLEDMFSVKGKVALVPGGSSGLGFDIALRLLQGGAKVVIASNSPWMPYPVFGGYSHYAASKGAVIALATQAAKELKRFGIMVNAVAPGGMVTPGSAGNLASEMLSDEKQDEFYDELMVWRTDGQQPVDEVAIIAYALATPMADGITGECVVADSGASHNIFRFQPAIEQYPPED